MAPPPQVKPQIKPPGSALGTLAVLVLMLGVVGLGFVAQNAVAGEPPRPIDIGRGVSVTPPAWEWQFAGRTEDGLTVLLSRGNASLAISLDERDAMAALSALREEWLADATVSAGEISEVTDLRSGQRVLRFAYTGTFADLGAPVEGEVTAVQGSTVSVIFDGWADIGSYVSARDEIGQMISGAQIP